MHVANSTCSQSSMNSQRWERPGWREKMGEGRDKRDIIKAATQDSYIQTDYKVYTE